MTTTMATMAATPAKTAGTGSESHQSSAKLLESLSSVLPEGQKFRAYHLSTPPTRTEALFAPPPNARPDRTYCESHFLAISILVPFNASSDDCSNSADKEVPADREVLVLALEILIYTTAYTSTFFVSKADSTGYLHLLNLPKGTPSPIREVSSAFITYLVRQRRRKGIQSIVSLFARAQGQYLFPGSVEYKGKHVLTDRGLVKWWCRVLTPLLDANANNTMLDSWRAVKGYLLVPGLDQYETRAFIPKTGAGNTVNPNWVLGHPLEKISHYTQEYDWVPPRCLIAHYPDDPKSRFRDELDLEADDGKGRNGQWKSVHSLDQFWELMAFRQECSMGALTGFIWLVMDPHEPNKRQIVSAPSSQLEDSAMITPAASFDASSYPAAPSTPLRKTNKQTLALRTPQKSPEKLFGTSKAPDTSSATKEKAKKKKTKQKKLTGPIIAREPRIKTAQRNYLVDRPITTPYYYWPPEGRGRRLVKEDGYKSSLELLLRLDFANLELATGSTRRWINEVGLGMAWGLDVVGTRPLPLSSSNSTSEPAVSNISGLIKRKRSETGTADKDTEQGPKVNVLGAGLVRKKNKDNEPPPTSVLKTAASQPEINVLGAGLIRKKPKPA
ncbi:hypothetical protein PpBr36_02797 [Pyricularia pennisetigena]|uniref:hypothetical protein n=1 Tax=Pyricularia pennisetigena TaxID=1578925 RepID=UPI001152FEB5|nr:hypothetical protein PpBr36_02797 [Pyricularia pennisetigena]TLS30308.1 hypothetical protein PpBr36_02797 [Pyricularia pennisetigena]